MNDLQNSAIQRLAGDARKLKSAKGFGWIAAFSQWRTRHDIARDIEEVLRLVTNR